MNLQDIMPSDISQLQNNKYYLTTYMSYLEWSNLETESRMEVVRVLVQGGNGWEDVDQWV